MTNEQDLLKLRELSRPFCILEEQQILQFEKLLILFTEYNAHTNLSAIREREAIVIKHFVDSLALLSFESLSGKNILDIGTGGGFPGIPLLIAVPDLMATLLDSVAKKTRACTHFMTELGIARGTAVHARAQDLVIGPNKRDYIGAYDLVVSRATAAMPEILSWAAPFITGEGSIILYKTSSPEELQAGKAAARKLGLKLSQTYKYILADQERYLFKFIRA